jgi:hypothetical protein
LGPKPRQLQADVDALVERLGVDGGCPDIMSAIAPLVSARRTRDMEAVRSAIAEFEATVRRVSLIDFQSALPGSALGE